MRNILREKVVKCVVKNGLGIKTEAQKAIKEFNDNKEFTTSEMVDYCFKHEGVEFEGETNYNDFRKKVVCTKIGSALYICPSSVGIPNIMWRIKRAE